ncbi:MAG: hypothetical protein ABI905_06580 [Betaproteobacteria bacterium]
MNTKISTKTVVANEEELNRDPLTGTPGAHPLGTGAGAASAGLAGAALGMVVGGPVGSVIGAAVGAVAGGLTGKGLAETVNPTAEEIYWRETYLREPFYAEGKAYEYYAPGFRAGWEGRVRFDGRTFAEAEGDLAADYILTKSEIDAPWSEVRLAAEAAWNRVDRGWGRPA